MPTLTDGVLFGLGILVLDFLAWRFMDKKSDRGASPCVRSCSVCRPTCCSARG
jgi:hypothetical protein